MSNNEQLFAEIIPSEEATLSGGNGGHRRGRRFKNDAYAGATADARGRNTFARTDTDAYVVEGELSSAYSFSEASSY